MRSFTYDAVGGRVVFGAGARRALPAELDALGTRRVLVVASEREEAALSGELAGLLGERLAGRFRDVVQHVPVAQAEAARARADELDVDTLVTIGGGSAVGVGKAVALARDVRQVVLPTTYAGSEMTTIWGITDRGRKRTGTDPRVKPEVVLYDPELTLTLPPAIAGPSGVNALAHCVEALYGPGANPVVTLMALEGIRVLRRSLPAVCAAPGDLAARTEALYGAYLAAAALASGGTALHHKTCHVLGGMFGLDHGGLNAVVLGHALAYNAPAVPEVVEAVAAALGTDDAPGALFDLAAEVGAPTSLAALGMPAGGLDAAAERVAVAAEGNVRPVDVAGARRLLGDAFAGRRPAAVRTETRPARPADTRGSDG
ncbi:MAG TPA: maleylacetate reductase [Acidimicrobiales bacterium]|nr:maleylacetate reductase [Acidimicrobiales bacterium]